MADATAARQVGARLLSEVEEGSLEELLNLLRANFVNTTTNTTNTTAATAATAATTATSSTTHPLHHHHHHHHRHYHAPLPIPSLAHLATRHQYATQSAPPPFLSISGRYLPLLYHLISTLLAPPHCYTVVLIDAEGRFDITRLISPPSSFSASSTSNSSTTTGGCTPQDLRHLYVYRPTTQDPGQIKAVLGAAREFMLYGKHGSRDREWWGTVVIGGGGGWGGGGGGDVIAGWKGWLKVEREEAEGSRFRAGISAEEALVLQRARAQAQRAQQAQEAQEMEDEEGEEGKEGKEGKEEKAGKEDDAGDRWVASSPWGSYRWRERVSVIIRG